MDRVSTLAYFHARRQAKRWHSLASRHVYLDRDDIDQEIATRTLAKLRRFDGEFYRFPWAKVTEQAAVDYVRGVYAEMRADYVRPEPGEGDRADRGAFLTGSRNSGTNYRLVYPTDDFGAGGDSEDDDSNDQEEAFSAYVYQNRPRTEGHGDEFAAVDVLNSIDPCYRDIAYLTAEGHSQAEVAAMLGISEVTIRNRRRVARERFRESA